ncbi:MAG: hypothetical protein GKR90_15925 [Pseudomonadales bacterium]|nr:hypothetical protein [Pseudomonadales bacterium]
MKRFVSNILLVSMVLLTQGCLSKSGPLWLVADNIDLKEYREEQIHVLPVVVSDAANFSRSEARKLQRLAADSLKLSLRLREISTPKQLSLPLTYPVDRGQVEALFDKSPDISAVVVVSVYERSLGSDFSDASLGLRLSLFDSEDPEKRLVISRRYISGNGRLDADSTRLSFAL